MRSALSSSVSTAATSATPSGSGLKLRPDGNSIAPLELSGSEDRSRYGNLWHRADQRFSLLKHRGGEIALTEFDLDTSCVSEYKLK